MHTAAPTLDASGGGGLVAFALWPDRRVVALRSMLPLLPEGSPTAWVHVAYEGEWQGHPTGGFAFTRDVFGQIVANFEAQANPIPVDFDHEREFMPPPLPARGWVHEMEIRDGTDGLAHLYALVEFGDKAARFVREGGYPFCSGVFDFGAVDRKSGEDIGVEMRSLALCADPFVDGQEPIRLSRRSAALTHGDKMDKFSKESLLKALELLEADEVSLDELMAAAGMAAAQDGGLSAEEPEAPAPAMSDKAAEEEEEIDASDAPPAEPVAASAPEPEAEVALEDDPAAEGEGAAAEMLAQRLMDATGLDPAALLAAIEERLDAVVGALTGALDEDATAPLSAAQAQVEALESTVATLSRELKGYRDAEAKAQREAADAEVAQLIEAGRIPEAKRDFFAHLCLSDRKTFDTVAEALKPVVPLGRHASATETARGEDKSLPEPTKDEVRQYVKTYLSGIPNLTEERATELARAGLKRIAQKRGN